MFGHSLFCYSHFHSEQLEYFNKSSNNKLEDGDETTCLGAQKEKIRVKLKEKRTSKAFIQVYLSGKCVCLITVSRSYDLKSDVATCDFVPLKEN